MSTRGPGRRGTCHLTDFPQTRPGERVHPKTPQAKAVRSVNFSKRILTTPLVFQGKPLKTHQNMAVKLEALLLLLFRRFHFYLAWALVNPLLVHSERNLTNFKIRYFRNQISPMPLEIFGFESGRAKVASKVASWPGQLCPKPLLTKSRKTFLGSHHLFSALDPRKVRHFRHRVYHVIISITREKKIQKQVLGRMNVWNIFRHALNTGLYGPGSNTGYKYG